MGQLGENIVIGIGTGLASGLITGLYSGLVISRRNRFDSLRSQLLRHANSIQYMQEPSGVVIHRGTSDQILSVAGELAHFGHRKAASAVLAANGVVASALFASERGALDVDELEIRLKEARDAFRSIRPSARTYLPWGLV